MGIRCQLDVLLRGNDHPELRQRWRPKSNLPKWLKENSNLNNIGGVKNKNKNCFTPQIQRFQKNKERQKGSTRKTETIIIDSDKDYKYPILIDCKIEDNQPITIDTDDNDNDKITIIQELEIEEINQENDIMDFVHASQDDNYSSDDNKLEESKPLQFL